MAWSTRRVSDAIHNRAWIEGINAANNTVPSHHRRTCASAGMSKEWVKIPRFICQSIMFSTVIRAMCRT
jgi:hypothetical protein